MHPSLKQAPCSMDTFVDQVACHLHDHLRSSVDLLRALVLHDTDGQHDLSRVLVKF